MPLASSLASMFGPACEAQQRFWQSVVDTMNEGLLLISPDRRIVYINQKAEEITGAELGRVADVVCTDAVNCPQCACRCRLFDEGEINAVEVVVYEARTGKPRTLLKNGRLLRDANGQVICGVETFQDITAEVAEREEARRNTALLFDEKNEKEALLAALPEGVCTIDRAGHILRLSSRMAELVGVGVDAAIGRDLFELLGVPRPTEEARRRGLGAVAETSRATVLLRDGSGAEQTAELVLRAVPFRDGELVGVLRPLPRLDRAVARTGFSGIVSRSPEMEAVFRLIESAAASPAGVLVEGESGTGKELVARAVHDLSPRRDEPFYAVNCATFQGSLLLSELFGHERGAFTGAYRTTKGKLELAGAGTLFLDEINQIPMQYQGVLLRVLEERAFDRVGGAQRIPLRARIVAATNERLAEAVRAGRFREDLYYRLRVFPIAVPPLRARLADVDLLVDYFVQHPAVNLSAKRLQLTDAARAALREHDWPGNVRELRNLIEYLCCQREEIVDVPDLPPELRRPGGAPSQRATGDGADLAQITDEAARISAALERSGHRRAEAARLLGIDRTTLWRRMARLGL